MECVGAEEVPTKGFVDEDDDITASVSVSGTRGFMAPEVWDRAFCHIYNQRFLTLVL